jgi:hypothetical protein
MKRTSLLAALVWAPALFATVPAFADTPAEKPVATSASPNVESQPKARSASKPGRQGRANADARHCLELRTNREIIKCAERYL